MQKDHSLAYYELYNPYDNIIGKNDYNLKEKLNEFKQILIIKII